MKCEVTRVMIEDLSSFTGIDIVKNLEKVLSDQLDDDFNLTDAKAINESRLQKLKDILDGEQIEF